MAQTIVEKILSRRTDNHVSAGEIVIAPVDYVCSQDGNRPQVSEVFVDIGGTQVFDRERVIAVRDHAPNAHLPTYAAAHKQMSEFAESQGTKLYDGGAGISNLLLPDSGYVRPGGIVLATDSHTVTGGALNSLATGVGATDLAVATMLGKVWLKVPETIRIECSGHLRPHVSAKDLILTIVAQLGAAGATYCSIEYHGTAISALSMESRMTVANMSVEMGAKFGLMEVDNQTRDYLSSRGVTDYQPASSDINAHFGARYEFDATGIVPMVALPPSPDQVSTVSDAAGTPVHQATIGTCTNSQIEDLRAAANMLRDNKIASGVSVYVTPGTRAAYLAAQREGILGLLFEAGARIGTPGCGGCLGAAGFGIPGDGDNMISTGNRNFVGRTGNRLANIYLASPETVMASAVAGEITDPRHL